ncbi:hypothetical protein [Gymnodinialimonas sp.]
MTNETTDDGDEPLEDFEVTEVSIGESQNLLMRRDWSDAVRTYIRYSSAFTMGIIASALAFDVALVLLEVDSDPADRLLNTEVLLALIAASVAQIGAIAYLIGKSIFK